jgi:hypothetical protein
MGHQIIKQPDGRYAIFSSVVDSWIVYDATRQDVIDYYVKKAAKEAKRDAKRTLDLIEEDPCKAYYQFAMTFAEANATSKAHGGEVLDGPVDEKVLAELTAAWGDAEDEDEGIGMNDEPELLTCDEAAALLPDGDRVHTFLNPGGILVGADWDRAEILTLLRDSPRREVTGPEAQSFGHGLAALREDGTIVFIATRQPGGKQ